MDIFTSVKLLGSQTLKGSGKILDGIGDIAAGAAALFIAKAVTVWVAPTSNGLAVAKVVAKHLTAHGLVAEAKYGFSGEPASVQLFFAVNATAEERKEAVAKALHLLQHAEISEEVSHG